MRWLSLVLFVQTALCIAVTMLSAPTEAAAMTATATLKPSSVSLCCSTTQSVTSTSITEVKPELLSALVTIAPLVVNPLERRQRCWDDRGFSVDCATWTGYYYTWGPPGNPYEGGPGEDGNGGDGGGGSSVVVYQNYAHSSDGRGWLFMLGILCLCLLLFI
ncbi:hypothetical protein HRR83_008066 [Exophiala dermatitidis]|uniref:Hydrophobin n=1 Tax=Exophiala dermatitidis TaxID=5970 RepID=A0AAN6ERK5_EXODE|nr:hypothetical protein HRR74_008816 [Exophiala dermatitidis]KAJ4513496.1 hypothetical protein HRR73_005654 [Exophiala dermatitidis]KAJ4535728.1 hypothetical protein HRR77_007675 [Exophiala dermatitidis]KAJ4544589.1 hypothetical protein HRR76_002643 [Exophiala dermatitidis]KAJ4561347.1 hypothetical protein HRR79_007181 [Exophiala dermatitidis]